MREQSWGLVIAVAATLVLLVFTGYQLLQRDEPEQEPSEPAPSAEIAEPAPPPEPRYPIEEPQPEPAASGEAEPQAEQAPAEPARPPLPALDESDEPFTDSVDELLPDDEDAAPELRDRLIRKIVATVDGLEREALPERVRPLEPVPGSFRVSGKVDGDLYILSPANYERYDALVNTAAEVDLSSAADLYRRYYPLFQQAWAELGYPDSYFNDRLVVVIEHLLATPDVADPVRLVRPHVLYKFENPVLEGLSPGQKLLIRMGPENRATVKTLLRQFRAEITGMADDVDDIAGEPSDSDNSGGNADTE
jgi:hypothetical protein